MLFCIQPGSQSGQRRRGSAGQLGKPGDYQDQRLGLRRWVCGPLTDLLGQGLKLSRGNCIEVQPEPASILIEDDQPTAPITTPLQQRHQTPDTLLVIRRKARGSAAPLDCLGRRSGRVFRQTPGRSYGSLLEPPSGPIQPFLRLRCAGYVEAFEQVPPVELQRRRKPVLSQGPLEFAGVTPEGSGSDPQFFVASSFDDCFAYCLAQKEQRPAQCGPCVRLIQLGPEQPEQHIPAGPSIAHFDRQPAQQGEPFGLFEHSPQLGTGAVAQAEGSEGAQLEHWRVAAGEGGSRCRGFGWVTGAG